jgi:hypothetical protein
MIQIVKDLPIAVKLWARFSKYAQTLNITEETVWKEFLNANHNIIDKIKVSKALDNWLINIADENDRIIYYNAFNNENSVPQPVAVPPQEEEENESGYDAEIT